MLSSSHPFSRRHIGLAHALVLSLLSGVTGSAAFANPSTSSPKSSSAEAEVWTVPTQQAWTRQVTLEASVEAVRQAVLSTQVPGAIVSVSVKAGDRVRAGQELMRVDARAAQQQALSSRAQLQAAQAQLRVAALDLQRQKQLLERQFISQGAMDKAQMAYDAANAQVDAMMAQSKVAQVQTDFYVIHAPYAGVVSDVPVVLGDMTMPGKPMVVMHAPGDMRLSVAVAQSLASWAKQARGLRYEIEGVTRAPMTATQMEWLPSADPATRTQTLRLPLPADLIGLVPGMAGKVEFQGQDVAQSERIWVPLRALVQRAELHALRVRNAQGGFSLRQVRTGARLGDQVEILSGLRPGEEVLLTPVAPGAGSPAMRPGE